MTPPEIHERILYDGRSKLMRFIDRIHHKHYPARETWTRDGSSWAADPNAWTYCACGARQRLWTSFDNTWEEPS